MFSAAKAPTLRREHASVGCLEIFPRGQGEDLDRFDAPASGGIVRMRAQMFQTDMAGKPRGSDVCRHHLAPGSVGGKPLEGKPQERAANVAAETLVPIARVHPPADFGEAFAL